jgi:hypothetical protein
MPAVLLRLYPVAFRVRWGEDLCADAESAGRRSWPNLVTGAVDMWLHPAIWPTAWPAQRNSRAAAMAILITVACWLVAHLTTEPGSPGYALALDGCAILLGVGLLLLAPLPRISASGLLLGRSARMLAVPVLLAGIVVVVANSPLDPVGQPGLRLLVLLAWWGSWVLGVIQGCRVVAGLGPDVVIPPALSRTRLGVAVLTAASAAAAGTIAVFAALHPAPLPALLSIAAALSTLACGAARRDLAPG